jgi:glycosyl transferase, family 25
MSGTPAVFVINLDYRTDRRTEMLRQLSRIGWRAEFFAAIRPESAADFPSIGARGCFLSHLSVLKRARDIDARQLVILEDDMNFVPQFPQAWKISMSVLETQEWSIFYPGHIITGLPPGLSRIPSSTGVQTSHFLVINGPAISRLISGLEIILARPAGHPLGGPMHVDGAYSTIRAQDCALITYAHSPVLGYQRSSRTDVGDLKWFDRIKLVAPIANFGRKLKSLSKA